MGNSEFKSVESHGKSSSSPPVDRSERTLPSNCGWSCSSEHSWFGRSGCNDATQWASDVGHCYRYQRQVNVEAIQWPSGAGST